jgi:hypothetical protein
MGYLINNGIIQISGTISAAEVNSLGSVPYIFTTPENFIPLGFAITVLSGITQPIFTDLLNVQTVTSSRIVFVGTDPGAISVYNFYGFRILPIISPKYTEALNIEIFTNNYQLLPADNLDPTPGDFTYKYNLIGTILQ